jgi:hypothetical protein
MQKDTLELDQLQMVYKAAVKEWIAAIKQEEALASGDHSMAEVDRWEQAHFREDEIRSKVKATSFQVRSATVQHRRHGGVNGRGKGRGQGL